MAWSKFESFPKLGGITILGVPIIRTIVFWGLYWGPLILGDYHFLKMEHASNTYLSSGQNWMGALGCLGFPKASHRKLHGLGFRV